MTTGMADILLQTLKIFSFTICLPHFGYSWKSLRVLLHVCLHEYSIPPDDGEIDGNMLREKLDASQTDGKYVFIEW
jgi:hypothetical protein